MAGSNRILVLILAAVAFGVAVFAAAPAQAQQMTNIQVGDFYFCDSSLSGSVCTTEITEGDTVTWTFGGTYTHTVTGGNFDSGQQSSGTFSFTFDEAGTYSYQCNIHPTQMQGEIVVTAAAQDPDEPVENEPDDSMDNTGDMDNADDTGVEPDSGEPEVIVAPSAGTGPSAQGSSFVWLIAASAAAGVALVSGGLMLATRRER